MSARRTSTVASRIATVAAAGAFVISVAAGIDGARWDGVNPAGSGAGGTVAGARWDGVLADGARWD